jgi:hypothetical protein
MVSVAAMPMTQGARIRTVSQAAALGGDEWGTVQGCSREMCDLEP